jgi:hypothetical protein
MDIINTAKENTKLFCTRRNEFDLRYLYYEYHIEACYEGWLQPIYKGSSAFLQAFAVLG